LVKRSGQLVDRQQVKTAIADERRSRGDRVQCPLQTYVRRPLLEVSASGRPSRWNGRVGEVEQVRAFGIVETQRLSETVEHLGRRAADRPTF